MRGQSSHIFPRIAIDLLGSDTEPDQLLPPLLALQAELKERAIFTFFVSSDLAKKIPSEIRAIACDEVITMEDDPLTAVRKKKNSSIVQGMNLLQKKEIDAFISAGNTGALFASSQIFLPLLPGIERAALLTLLPTKRKEVALIDVGANLVCKADHLVQFALMAIAYQKSRGIARPAVGLLNIGTEPKKGTPELREAHARLHQLSAEDGSIHFIGNVEGRDVFKGEIDVLVTDGFSGNIFLKTAEGLAAFVLEQLEETAKALSFSPLTATLGTLRHRLHYAEYPGAILCGIEGIVVKCHGNASPQSFISSIKSALHLVDQGFLEKIRAELNILFC